MDSSRSFFSINNVMARSMNSIAEHTMMLGNSFSKNVIMPIMISATIVRIRIMYAYFFMLVICIWRSRDPSLYGIIKVAIVKYSEIVIMGIAVVT